MAVTNAEYIQAIKRNITEFGFRVILLDSDENELREITSDVLDGSINISLQNGSRRTASISIANTNNEYDFNSNNIWLDNKFRIQTGIVIEDELQLYDQGIFVIGETNSTNDTDGQSIQNYELYDKFSYLDGTISGTIVNTFSIPNGTNIVEAVRTVFQNAQNDGIQISFDIKPLLAEANSATLPYTMYSDKGKTYFDILDELANAISYTLYFDVLGYPRFEPTIDPEFQSPTLTLEESDILKATVNKRVEVTQVKNFIRVVGVTWDDGVTHDATSSRTTGATAISRIGRRALLIEDDVIYNDTLAQDRANFERDNLSKITETVNISFYPTDNLDVGLNIDFTDARVNLSNAVLQIRQLNLPLFKNTEASMDTQRTVDLS